MNFRKSAALFAALLFLAALPAGAAPDTRLKVVTTLPDYAAFAARIGGERVEVSSIVRGDQDAHFIRPKPSFVTLVGEADLLVATGLDLEMWLPTVVDKSGNGSVRSGQPGFVAASRGMPLLEKPQTLSRIEGGLHVYGNPHVTTSPLMMKHAVRNIAAGLAARDPAGADFYRANAKEVEAELDRRLYGEELVRLLGAPTLGKLAEKGELAKFLLSHDYRGRKLSTYAGGWLEKMLPFTGKPIVTWHKNWVYFLRLFGIEEAGTVEPKPGIPPSPRHVTELTETMKERGIRLILAANYFDESKVRTIAESIGAVPVVVPLYVGGEPGVDDYFGLFDLWVARITAGATKAGLIAPEGE